MGLIEKMNMRKKIILLAAACLIVLFYANSLRGPLYLDDSVGTDFLAGLKLDGLTFGGLYNAALKGPVKNSPLANLSLARNGHLNKKPNPATFHIVDVIIHLAGFLAIFFFLKELLGLPPIPEGIRKKAFGLALSASTLWAVHPIQTQAVTFVAQRATSLAAVFYFLTLLFYLKGRLGKKRIPFYLAAGISFILALGSKEIAVSLPLAVFFLEWIFFATEKKKLLALLGAAALLFLMTTTIFIGGGLGAQPAGKPPDSGPPPDFSMKSRLLGVPSVLLHDISLVLLPFHSRYILYDRSQPSASLLSPVSTAAGFFLALAAAVLACIFAKKNRLLSLCVLLFLLTQAAGSFAWTPGAVSADRMYAASVFLILICLALGSDLAAKFRVDPRIVKALLILLALYLGFNTYLRNRLAADPVRFLTDNVRKAPFDIRPLHNLGALYAAAGRNDEANQYYLRALALNPANGVTQLRIAESFYAKERYDQAIPYFERAVELLGKDSGAYADLTSSYLKTKRYENALKIALQGLERHPDDPGILLNIGSLYFFLEQSLGNEARPLLEKFGLNESKAFEYLEKAYLGGSHHKDLYANLPGIYLRKARTEQDLDKRSEYVSKAEKILEEGRKLFPGDEDLKGNLVRFYVSQGNWKEALLLPGLVKADYGLVVLFLMRRGFFSEALEVLKDMESRFGRDEMTEFNRAVCSYSLGNKEEAVETFKRILETTDKPPLKKQAEYLIKEWEKSKAPKK